MGKKLEFWLVIAGLLLQTVLVSAQNIDTLTGVVVDIRNNQPVENAKAYLEERAEFSTTSDESGHFKLKFDPPLQIGETVKVHVEKKGFKPLTRSLQISERVLTLELTPVGGPNYRKWISLGISLAAAGAAVAFFQAANDSRENAEASRTESEFEQFDDEFHRNKVFTLTFEIVAGAAGGYFIYEQIFKEKPSSAIIREEADVHIQINPHFTQKEVIVVFQKRF